MPESAPDDVEPFPTTYIAIPWSEAYNPYQFHAWAAIATPPAASSGHMTS